jgi:hypothetical protein
MAYLLIAIVIAMGAVMELKTYLHKKKVEKNYREFKNKVTNNNKSMPYLTETTRIAITPEKFLNACSVNELQEVNILIQSPRFKNKLAGENFIVDEFPPNWNKFKLKLASDISGVEEPRKITTGIYACMVCDKNQVDADNAEFICTECLAKPY